MIDFKKLIDETVAASVNEKPKFNILFISDEDSRLNDLRGIAAMNQFKHFYGNIATVHVTSMESARFCELETSLAGYNVIWIDNVISRKFNAAIAERSGAILDGLVPGWREEAKSLDGDARKEYISLANEYRSLKLHTVYCLDEFVWDAPAGRRHTVIEALTVQESMEISDTVIVPNVEMASALTELELVEKDKEVLVLPTFVGDSFYPIHDLPLKSGKGVSQIRKPKILCKGTTLSKNVQNLIINYADQYDFTICTVGELDDRIMRMLRTPKSKEQPTVPLVANVMHWANPYVTKRNILATMAMERDSKFDFVILCEPDDIANDIYHITITDTDALIGVASGSVVIAEIDDAEFGKGVHLCQETGLTFGKDTHVKDIAQMIEKWRPVVSWDEAYKAQRKLLEQRTVSSGSIMAGFFHSMLGKKVSEARKDKFADEDQGGVKTDTASTQE